MRILNECYALVYDERLETLKEIAEKLELTGYCADYYLKEYLEDYEGPYTTRRLEYFYGLKWEQELESRLNDVKGIEETIRANEYEFTEDGEIH